MQKDLPVINYAKPNRSDKNSLKSSFNRAENVTFGLLKPPTFRSLRSFSNQTQPQDYTIFTNGSIIRVCCSGWALLQTSVERQLRKQWVHMTPLLVAWEWKNIKAAIGATAWLVKQQMTMLSQWQTPKACFIRSRMACFTKSGPTFLHTCWGPHMHMNLLSWAHRSAWLKRCWLKRSQMQGVLKLDKSDISEAGVDKLFREKELR